MQNESGMLVLGRSGTLCLTIAEETYRITRDDIHALLFYGQSVPLTRTEETVHPGGVVVTTSVIDGSLTVHTSGRAVLVAAKAGSFVIPFVSFQRIARGEAVSLPLFPLVPGITGDVV